MTDILLIQPPIRDYYLTRKRTVPYGLACIAGALEQHGFRVTLFDALASGKQRRIDRPGEMAYLDAYYGHPDMSPFALFHHFMHFGYSYATIEAVVRDTRPFLVGISALFTPYSAEALKTAEVVKAARPDCRVVVGGHHPTALPEAVMAHPAVDFVIRGEGEAAMPALAAALRSGRDPRSVPGIVTRRPGGQLHISPPAVNADLDALPMPAFHLLAKRHYRRRGRGSAVITTSRGCPFHCTYCSLASGGHIPYRRRSVGSVMRELSHQIRSHDARFIDFEDEHLTLDRHWFRSLLSDLRRLPGADQLELRAMNGLFPASLNESVIGAMHAAGFSGLNLSVGSADPAQLRRFNRPPSAQAFADAAAIAGRHDMSSVGYVIAGAPDQTPETSIKDILFIADQPALVGLSVFYPSPGSRDYARCHQMGLLPGSERLMRSSALPVVHRTDRQALVTLMRIARLINFMKSIVDNGEAMPRAAPYDGCPKRPVDDRRRIGRLLLSWFFHDGIIRGVTPEGRIYDHLQDARLSRLSRAYCLSHANTLKGSR